MFKKVVASVVVVMMFMGTVSAQETRCGWIENDAPMQITIEDKDGTWVIMDHGHDTIGWISNLPELSNQSNCGCIKGTFDKSTKQVKEIFSGNLKSDKVCQKDPNLK